MIASINNNQLIIKNNSQLVQGTVGATIGVAFTDDWSALSKTAVFSAGDLSRDVAVFGDSITIPWELLAESGHKLLLNFHGALPDGSIVLRTNIVSIGTIQPSRAPSGQEPEAPSPSRADQIQAIAEQAAEDVQRLWDSASAGLFEGKDGIDGVSPSVSVSSIAGGHSVTITDATETIQFSVMDGAKGEKGDRGEKGETGSPGPRGPKGDSGEVTQGAFDELSENVAKIKSTVLNVQVGENKLNTDELVNGYYYSPTRKVDDDRYWYNPKGYIVNPGEYVYVVYLADRRRTDNSIRSYCLLNTDGTLAQALTEDLSVINANAYKYHNETSNTYLFVANFWLSYGTDFTLYITDKSPANFDYLKYVPYRKDSVRLQEIESNVEEAKNTLNNPILLSNPVDTFEHFSTQRYYQQSGTNKIIASQTGGNNYKCFGVDITDLSGVIYLYSSKSSEYKTVYVSDTPENQAVAIGSFNYSNVKVLNIGTLTDYDSDTLVTLDVAKILERYPTAKALYITVSIDDKYGCFATLETKSISPFLYADGSIPNKALRRADRYVLATDSLLVEEEEVSYTAPAGTYRSTEKIYALEDLGIAAGDHVYVTIGGQIGCLNNDIFSLEAYNGATRLLQKWITKTTMATDMVIPDETDNLHLVYRLCTTSAAVSGDTATWSNIKLYYYIKEDGAKVIPPKYYIPNALTEEALGSLKTKTERSMLFDTSVYGNVDTAIENAFSTIGRKKFLMLAWVSDLHRRPFTGTSEAPAANPDTVFYNTVEVMKYLNKRLPLHAVLDTGDIILGMQPFFGFTEDVNFKYEAEYFRSFNEACELYLYTPGNHDGYNANSVTLQDTDYQIGASALNRKVESKQPGKCYYYIDYPDIKTRLLVLAVPGGGASLGMDTEQLQWIATTGLGNVPDGYGVIMAYHIPTVCISYLEGGDGGFGNRVSFEGVINAFHNHSTYSDSIVSADFSNKTGTKIVAALCGHMHFDAVSNPGEVFTQDKGRDGTSKAGESLTNHLPCKQIMINATYNKVIDILIYIPEDNKIYTKRIGTGANKEIVVN